MKDKEKQIDRSWKAKMVEKGLYKDSETTSEEKQVEEICKMAVMGCRKNPQAYTVEECVNCDFKKGMCDVYRVAEKIYEQGYRKLPEDSVVLSRDAYQVMETKIEKLTKYAENERQLREHYCNEASKETAEKIYKELYENRFQFGAGIFSIKIPKFIELAKQSGVEIKE